MVPISPFVGACGVRRAKIVLELQQWKRMTECEEYKRGFKACSWWGFFNFLYRAWYVDGRILVVTVTFGIILPLCLLKNLGKT